jgi:OmpA-OmpF porin, OOP family
MSNSVISSLTNLLDRQAINNIALRIGESEESVSRALGPTLAAILNGMATKTNDPGVLRYMFDMVSGVPASSLSTATIINLATSGAAGSPLFDFGRRLLPILFEGNQGAVAESIEQTSRLSSGGATRMISMAVPVMLGFLSKRVREEGLDLAGFTELLQHEASASESSTPAERSNDLGAATTAVSPMRAQQVAHGFPRWLLFVIAGLAALAVLIWFAERGSILASGWRSVARADCRATTVATTFTS